MERKIKRLTGFAKARGERMEDCIGAGVPPSYVGKYHKNFLIEK